MTIVKRSVMTLFSAENDVYSHQVRIVLAEKGVTVDIISVDPNDLPEDLLELNPYGTLPTLIDRDLVLYETRVIIEYLDERFPHPPLLPVYPVARAKCRLMMVRVEQDWYQLLSKIQQGNVKEVERARKELRDGLVSLAPVFAEMPYFLSEEFTLVDCCLMPLLWRLPRAGIKLPPSAKAIQAYAKRMFKRESFRASMSEIEREMKNDHDL